MNNKEFIKEFVNNKKEELKTEFSKLEKPAKLLVIQVGNNPASNSYIKGKLKDAEFLNIQADLLKLEETITEQELLDIIHKNNNDDMYNGFIVQLPLPKHISEEKIKSAVSPDKDVDGFNILSKTVPCTPLGVLHLIKDGLKTELKGKNAVVIGRSEIVGKPMAKLLLKESCNVTVLHSKTSKEDLSFYVEHADIIVCATGHRHTLDPEKHKLKPSCILIDVGINRNEEGKLCGDCEDQFDIQFQSPVPGGVGLLTRVYLYENLLTLSKLK